MKPDLYTRAVLTVIAGAIVVLAINQYVNSRTGAGPIFLLGYSSPAKVLLSTRMTRALVMCGYTECPTVWAWISKIIVGITWGK